MIRKIRLDGMGKFERSLAVEKLSSMLVAFLEGLEHPVCLGREQGGIPGWDDFVVVHRDGSFEHTQAKYQHSDFDDTHFSLRGKKRRSDSLQDLSELDKTMKQLADWFRGEPTEPENRKFWLVIPNASLNIKKDLALTALVEMCSDCKKAGVSALRLQERSNSDATTKKLENWLTSWCGFEGWNRIFQCLEPLYIRTAALSEDLDRKSEEALRPWFSDAQGARKAILQFLEENTTDVGGITPRLLFAAVENIVLAHRYRWTQFCRDDSTRNWSIAGTNGPANQEYECSKAAVRALWGSHNCSRHLRLEANWKLEHLPVSIYRSLLRLASHIRGPNQVQLGQLEEWQQRFFQLVGTLGVDEGNRIADWMASAAKLFPVGGRSIQGSAEANDEAELLHKEMDIAFWVLLRDKVGDKLESMALGELKNLCENSWAQWEQNFNQNAAEFRIFCQGMVSPKAEGDEIYSIARVGPKTLGILTDGIMLHLVVLAGIEGSSSTWKKIGDKTVKTIALRSWSGPSGAARINSQLDLNAGVILAKENSDLIILSGVEASGSEFRNDGLASDAIQRLSMGEIKNPDLITNHHALRRHILNSDMVEIRGYLLREMQPMQAFTEQAIRSIVTG